MTSAMAEKSYQAVVCVHCSEPIPLSVKLQALFVESDATTDQQIHAQAFVMRCESCSKESHYLKSEIETFDGEPPQSGDRKLPGSRRYPRSLRKASGQ
jgi:hypothetical protein